MNHLRSLLPLIVVSAVLLPACNTTGPAAVRRARQPYNEALAITRDQQQLLNLVRLKYRDVPLFLEVGSVSTQYQWDSTLGGGTTFFESGSPSEPKFDASAGIKWSEKPTVTYAPLQGEKFVKQLMSPIPLEVLVLLSRSGWSFQRIFRLSAQGINGVPNAPSASGPTPARAPAFETYRRAGELIREMQQDGTAELAFAASDAGTRLRLRFSATGSSSPQAQEVRELLGLRPALGDYDIVPDAGVRHSAGSDRLHVTPRSYLGVMFYLCHAVEVPEDHVEEGLVTQTVGADGAAFDWNELTGDLLTIRTSSREPSDAFVSVPYRGAWFYIADSDLNSKSTFALLSYLFALQAGDRKSVTPALTLPL